jgi:hypothetical protein
MKLYVITIATHNDYYLPYLKESCYKNGYELIILGYGEKWKGFNWRNKLVLNFLEKTKDDDIICYIDGFDVICCRNLKELPNVFNNLVTLHNCKIIVGEHKFVKNKLNYLQYLFNSIYFSKCKNMLLNAGTYISKSKDLKYILQKIYFTNPNDKLDDQILLTEYCINNLSNIYIDTKNEIFLTLQNSYNEIDDLLNIEYNKITYNNNSPFFIHGVGETYLDNIIIKLNYNYNYNDKVKNKLLKTYYSKKLFRFSNNDYYIIFIILFILFIFFIFYLFFINKKIKKIRNKK